MLGTPGGARSGPLGSPAPRSMTSIAFVNYSYQLNVNTMLEYLAASACQSGHSFTKMT